MASQSEDRSSRALEKAPLRQLSDSERDRTVLQNNLNQFDRMIELVDDGLKEKFYRLQSWMIQELNHFAVDGLIDHAGPWVTEGDQAAGAADVGLCALRCRCDAECKSASLRCEPHPDLVGTAYPGICTTTTGAADSGCSQ